MRHTILISLIANAFVLAISSTQGESNSDAGVVYRDDAGTGDSGVRASSLPEDPCAAEEARIEKRKAWLKARDSEQRSRGGPPNGAKAIPDMAQLWCETHPGDEECKLGSLAVMVEPNEMVWGESSVIEDFEPHVIRFKRALVECRRRVKERNRVADDLDKEKGSEKLSNP